MNTLKVKLSSEQEIGLLDYVIYGDGTLTKLLNAPSANVDSDIKRCDEATRFLGTALRHTSEHNVCEDCKDEHSSLIRDVEEGHNELDHHFSSVTNAYAELAEENAELKNIIQDLIQYSLDAVPEDDLKEFEEQLILKTLNGEL